MKNCHPEFISGTRKHNPMTAIPLPSSTQLKLKMRLGVVGLVMLIILFCNISFSQSSNTFQIKDDYIISFSGNYVSSATILLNPFSADIYERNSSIELGGGYGYGFTFRKKIPKSDLYIALSTEYLKIYDDQNTQTLIQDTNYFKVRAYETLRLFPVELSLFFNVPSFSENLRIYLGGGLGLYFGDRIRKIIKFETTTTETRLGANIHILCGIQYYFSSNFSLFFETKFRNAQFTVSSQYSVNNVDINGITYYFEQYLKSKMNIDGIKLSIGTNLSF
jgi:hypothetical protein